MADNRPSVATERILGRLEAMDPVVTLEGARVTASPFDLEDLRSAAGHDQDFLDTDAPTPFPGLTQPADIQAAARFISLLRA